MIPWADAPLPPRRWQAEALPLIIDAVRSGTRTVVSAVTGSGKSILIAELLAVALERSGPRHQALIVGTPTQALVEQLAATIGERVGHERVGRYYGRAKQADRDVVVTCYPSVPQLRHALLASGRKPVLLVSDEVHRTQGDVIRAAVADLAPSSAIGFSATPYRADDKETLELWASIAYQYSLGDAWRDGVLVPFQVIPWDGAGDAKDVDAICLRLIQEHAPPGPGIVSALDIGDAEGYAGYLVAHGIPAAAIHSRLPPAVQEEHLAGLLDGSLRALVHVSMLSEGVDIPSIRWMCLRRPVRSRVRFVQEVGRSLRTLREPDAWGQKDRAYLLDPHDLFGRMGISHPAALGEPETREERAAREKEPDDEVEFLGRDMPAAVAVDRVSSWSRQLLLVLQAEGLAQTSRYSPQGEDEPGWRQRRASPQQIHALQRMSWARRYLPEEHRDGVAWACGQGGRLRRGAASDLLSILGAVADASRGARAVRRHWAWPDYIQVPGLEEEA